MKTLSSDEKVRRLAWDAALTGAALMLSFIESLIPLAPLPLPGFKPGLANIAVTVAAFRYSPKDAAAVSLCRILLNFLLFGNPVSLAFSLTGGAMVLVLLTLLLRTRIGSRLTGSVSFLGLSVLCALLHNAGQLAVSLLIMGSAPLSYVPALLCASAFYGALSGIVMNLLPPKIYQIGK